MCVPGWDGSLHVSFLEEAPETANGSPPRSAGGFRVGVACAVLAICYAPVAVSLYSVWSTNALYSYGFAVPCIAAYICYLEQSKRYSLRQLPDYRVGVPVALLGAVLLLVGRLGSVMTLEYISLVVTLAGLVLVVYGRQALQDYWFPVAYLLLMLPLWTYPLEWLQSPSQRVSAHVAAVFLGLAGVPASAAGTTIDLPGHTLLVLPQCSGVNQLIALGAMAGPAAYLWLKGAARRSAFVLGAVIVGYVSNGFRIAMSGWLLTQGLAASDVTDSFHHLLEGLLVSCAGYAALAALLFVLSSRGHASSEAVDPPAVAKRRPAGRLPSVALDVLVACVLVGVVPLAAQGPVDVPPTHALESFPTQIGDWTLDTSEPTTGILDRPVLNARVRADAQPASLAEGKFGYADDELLRTYRNEAGTRVQVFVGYYRRQQHEREITGTVTHAPVAKAPSTTVVTRAGTLCIERVINTDTDTQHGVICWYNVNGRILSNTFRVKLYTMFDSLVRRRSNGAVVMIGWSGTAQTPAHERDEAMSFVDLLIPVLEHYLSGYAGSAPPQSPPSLPG